MQGVLRQNIHPPILPSRQRLTHPLPSALITLLARDWPIHRGRPRLGQAWKHLRIMIPPPGCYIFEAMVMIKLLPRRVFAGKEETW